MTLCDTRITRATARPMFCRRFTVITRVAVGVAIGLGFGRAGFAATGDAALDNALAERLALIADETADNPKALDPFLRQAAALLDLARESSPKEVRFARSSANVLLRLGEGDRALAALAAVRALDPKDQLAQIQYIDLAANRMESADAREAYLQQVVDATGVSAEVRSHAAVSLMDLLYQRSEDARAAQLLDRALALNPQNLAALAEKYRQAAAAGDAIQRAKALSAWVMAAPLDGNRLSQVARDCIAAADYADAHNFYELVFSVALNRGQNPNIEDLLDLSGSELMSGISADIGPLVKQALGSIKDDGRLYAVDLLVSQFDDAKPEELAPAIAIARGVYLAQIAGASQLLNKPDEKEMPTTNPAVPLPDLTGDAAKLVANDPGQLKTAYTVALAEQLWFDLYFHAATVDDASIAALATLLGSDADPLVVRMQGWKLLSAGQTQEAKVKLAAVADRDGYAKLGLAAALTAEGKADEAKALINELIAARPSGMLASYLSVAAKRAGVKVDQTPAEQDVTRVFSDLKRPVGDALRNSRGLYLLTAQPVNLSVGPGEVMLARVTIQNTGRTPITIGPGAYIEPEFKVDLSVRGDASKLFPGTATGRWTGAIRLLPTQSISQVVRIDRGEAFGFFRAYPTPLLTISGLVTTNALVTPKGSIPTGGGQQTTIGNVMERKSSPLYIEAARQQLVNTIANGAPVERLNSMDLAAAIIPLLDSSNTANKDLRDQMIDALGKQLAKEPIEEVKAWCSVSRMAATGDSTDMEVIAKMKSPMARAALLVLARTMSAEPRKKLAQAMLDMKGQDGQVTDGPIAELAKAVIDQPELAPATRPTTGPVAP